MLIQGKIISDRSLNTLYFIDALQEGDSDGQRKFTRRYRKRGKCVGCLNSRLIISLLSYDSKI